ncbi:unnamed protein product [Owenia fusiformis]|uniref:Uncharacterized protein n=1 Tax=Owenia fusiformis TaxID=6347 RepID=A0A8J1Y0Q2_OWEFU|nr:unnamed protein product [Owenia fusiformis]
MLKFIDAVIDELKGQSRFGVATFSTNAKVEIYLGQYEDTDALQEAVFNIKYEPGQTNTAAGIQIVREQMFQAFNGGRASAPDYLILLTDGVSNLNSGQTINQADRASFEGIEIIAVGIGLKQDYEVNAIAHDENHVFAVDQFDQLSYVVDPVSKLICAGR